MTVSSNHEYGFVIARSLTAVGLRRASIGPPIIVMLRGSIGSLAVAMSEIAARTGTVGWQTDKTCRLGPRWRMNCWTYAM